MKHPLWATFVLRGMGALGFALAKLPRGFSLRLGAALGWLLQFLAWRRGLVRGNSRSTKV